MSFKNQETNTEKQEMPECPTCKSNKKVISTKEQHVMFKLYVARPNDTHFCMKCEEGFFFNKQGG